MTSSDKQGPQLSEGQAFLVTAAVGSATAIGVGIATAGLVSLTYMIPCLIAGLLLGHRLSGSPLAHRPSGAGPSSAGTRKFTGRVPRVILAIALVATIPAVAAGMGWVGVALVLTLACAALFWRPLF